jgi:hypothetical protein
VLGRWVDHLRRAVSSHTTGNRPDNGTRTRAYRAANGASQNRTRDSTSGCSRTYPNWMSAGFARYRISVGINFYGIFPWGVQRLSLWPIRFHL